MRSDGRQPNQLRNIVITPHFLKHPAGSCLFEMGNTRVVCSVMLEDNVPPFLKGSGKGWLTAEYNMIPGSSFQRISRERAKVGGRTQEIQRLIGRALRSAVDLDLLGEKSLVIDCDVLDADGGTRTASITGAYVALCLAIKKLSKNNLFLTKVVKNAVAAISVGMVNGVPTLDLHYDDDKNADVDMNVVKTSQNQYVEIQGTAEKATFDRAKLDELLKLADLGIEQLFAAQEKAIKG